MSDCYICKNPITSIEINLSGDRAICQECGNCIICGKQVTIDDIRTCLISNRTIKHDQCARVPRRRCSYLDNRGQQCDTWFPAIDASKLCPVHSQIITPNGHLAQEQSPKYIDLVNDERKYCYHFLNGTAQNQSQTLIHEFKDDAEGTVYEKLDSHIAFIEKVIEDLKARLHSARAVKSEKLDELTEDERKVLRATKIDKEFKKTPKEKAPSFKADPVAFLSKTKGMSKDDASALLSMDEDALLAKFARAKLAKQEKENQNKES